MLFGIWIVVRSRAEDEGGDGCYEFAILIIFSNFIVIFEAKLCWLRRTSVLEVYEIETNNVK